MVIAGAQHGLVHVPKGAQPQGILKQREVGIAAHRRILVGELGKIRPIMEVDEHVPAFMSNDSSDPGVCRTDPTGCCGRKTGSRPSSEQVQRVPLRDRRAQGDAERLNVKIAVGVLGQPPGRCPCS